MKNTLTYQMSSESLYKNQTHLKASRTCINMYSAFVDIEELGVAHFYFRVSCFDTIIHLHLPTLATDY